MILKAEGGRMVLRPVVDEREVAKDHLHAARARCSEC